MLSKAIQMRSGDLYSDRARTQTIAKLNHLGIFEYPTITYSYSDSLETSLNTIITLRPRERFELEFGLDLTQSNIQDQGIAFNSSINVLNIFGGAENFEFGVRGTIGRSADDVISEIGGDVRLRNTQNFNAQNDCKINPRKSTTHIRSQFWNGSSKQYRIGQTDL